jgi:hypothetical protein
MRCKLVGKILKISSYDVGKKKLKKDMDLKRHLFMPLYLKIGYIDFELEFGRTNH